MDLAVAAELTVREQRYPAMIRNLSPFGAFVSDVPRLASGTPVELTIAEAGGRHSTAGVVVHWLDDAAAARLGTTPGAGIRFRSAVGDRDVRFANAVTRLVAAREGAPPTRRRRRSEKPTAPIREPMLVGLTAAMNPAEPAEEGRVVFEGALAEIGLPSILTTLATGRKSGRLDVAREHVAASIDLLDGDIVDARTHGDAVGPYAILMMVLHWTDGSFRLSLTTLRPARVERRIRVSQLLLEHARLRDEVSPGDARRRRSLRPTRVL